MNDNSKHSRSIRVLIFTLGAFFASILSGYTYQTAPDNTDEEYIYLAKKKEDKELIHEAQEIYREALALYKARRFVEAKGKFTELETIFPNYKSTRRYLGRIDQDIGKEQEFTRQQESGQAKLEKNERKNREAEFYQQIRQEKMREHKLQVASPTSEPVKKEPLLQKEQPSSKSIKNNSSLESVPEEKPENLEASQDLKARVKEQQDKLKEERVVVQKGLLRGVEDLYRKAMELQKKGDLKDAKTIFLEIENLSPNYKLTRNFLKRIDKEMAKPSQSSETRKPTEQLVREREDKTKTEATISQKLSPVELEDTYAHAISLYNNKHLSEARKEFELVLKTNPDYKLVGRYLGLIDAQTRSGAIKNKKAKNVLREQKAREKQQKKEKKLAQKKTQEKSRLLEPEFSKVQKANPGDKAPWEKDESPEEDLSIMSAKAELKDITPKMQPIAQKAEVLYKQAMRFYLNKDYARAKTKFMELERMAPSYKSTKDYLQRIEARE